MPLLWFLLHSATAPSINCANGSDGGDPARCPSATPECLVKQSYKGIKAGDRCSNILGIMCSCQAGKAVTLPPRPSTPVATTTKPSTSVTTTSRPSTPVTTTTKLSTPVTTTTKPSTAVTTKPPTSGTTTTTGSRPSVDRCDSDDTCASNGNRKIKCDLEATEQKCVTVPARQVFPLLASKKTTPTRNISSILIICICVTWVLIFVLSCHIYRLHAESGVRVDHNSPHTSVLGMGRVTSMEEGVRGQTKSRIKKKKTSFRE
eukprot:GEMP01082361.1.p1 GENE.GEMP01082361.1~~GEMP01082361.1.p1  ORF type:complete len:261 (+),score=41.72 GEMP01082361.1:204-986(+)